MQIATDDVLSVMSEKGRAIRIGAIESPLLLPMTGCENNFHLVYYGILIDHNFPSTVLYCLTDYELQGRQQLCLPVEGNILTCIITIWMFISFTLFLC